MHKKRHMVINGVDPHEIADRVVSSLKSDFQLAAKKVNYNWLSTLSESTPVYIMDGTAKPYLRDVANLQFLLKGAHGEYIPHPETSLHSRTLWDDYLLYIQKSEGRVRNDYTINHLIKQNGPKKMEDRLRRFLKRRIDRVCQRSPKP